LLGTGELKHALTVKIDRASDKARKAIEAAGGTVEVTEAPRPEWVYKAKKTKKKAPPVAAKKEDVEEKAPVAEAEADADADASAEPEPEAKDGSAETTE
jgi:large subunit ribosomal protein L15